MKLLERQLKATECINTIIKNRIYTPEELGEILNMSVMTLWRKRKTCNWNIKQLNKIEKKFK